MNAFAADCRRTAAGLGVVGVVVGLAVACPATPAHAAACTGTGSGVTMVVDFSAFGGGVRVACASGDPASGLDALRRAGFTVAGTQRWGTAFVCRIDSRPGVADEPCVNTPPADKHWSYWHAPRGGTWSYSTLGAASYNPAPGAVEGWAFGNGARPGVAPPAAPRPPPPPVKPPVAPPPPAGGVATGGSGPGSGAGASTGVAPPAFGTAPLGPTDTGMPPDVSTVDDAAGLAELTSGGTAGGLSGVATGAAVVLALVGLAVWTARRRRTGAAAPP